jgi:hypothetical protein
MWPFAGDVTRDGHHRVIHIWSTRWHSSGGPVGWTGAQGLRQVAQEPTDTSFAEVFDGQLERQYRRVSERVPRLAGTPLPVRVAHRDDHGGEIWMEGHCFFAAMPSGHLLACLNLHYDGSLRELPSLLMDALVCGPELNVDSGSKPNKLKRCVNEAMDRVHKVKLDAGPGLPGGEDLALHLTSEMHSMVYACHGDDSLFDAQGTRDEELIRRLVGRLRNDDVCVKDDSIKWPNEFNKVKGTIGAVRPGASLIVGADPLASKNALVSTLLLMGAASLLREARDEVYAIQEETKTQIQADKAYFDPLARAPLGHELTRLAHVEIAVAFDVESHLDMRRLISDAMLVQWHGCFAETLAIPESVAALHQMAWHLTTAMKTVSERSTARNALILSALAALAAALAVVVTLLVTP